MHSHLDTITGIQSTSHHLHCTATCSSSVLQVMTSQRLLWWLEEGILDITSWTAMTLMMLLEG